MDFGGITILFQSLVGSHNYNLNTETSDKDYKTLVLPNFEDLYSGKKFNKTYVSDTKDYDIHEMVRNANTYINSLDSMVTVTCDIKKSQRDKLFKYAEKLNKRR